MLCPVTGEEPSDGKVFASHDAEARAHAVVNMLLWGKRLGRHADEVLHTGWHNPAAAYRAATLALQDGYYGGWFGRLPKRREVDGLFRRAMKDDP